MDNDTLFWLFLTIYIVWYVIKNSQTEGQLDMSTHIKEYDHEEGFTVKVRIYEGTNDSDDPTTCELIDWDCTEHCDTGIDYRDLEYWAFQEFLKENKR